jgi:hypothetical protein
MLSAFCGRSEDRTQYLGACKSNALPTNLPATAILCTRVTITTDSAGRVYVYLKKKRYNQKVTVVTPSWMPEVINTTDVIGQRGLGALD